MTEYKEIIIALIAVFGAVIPYLLQKNKELKLKIAGPKTRGVQQLLEELHRDSSGYHPRRGCIRKGCRYRPDVSQSLAAALWQR